MKYLLVVLVVVIGIWLLVRQRQAGRESGPPRARRSGQPPAPQAMLACAHCGVHLPAADALYDPAGRAFCSDAHRLAGPR